MSLNTVTTATITSTCMCGCTTRTRRYGSDTIDTQWAILAPMLPTPHRTGRPEKHHRRAILDALFYLVDNGVRWRDLPTDFPPWPTVYGFLTRWCDNLTAINLVDQLRQHLRSAAGRTPAPSAGCIDSQSVKESADAVVPATSSGYDAFKRVNGRKRHIIVDTCGHLISVHATAANTRDTTGARPLLDHAADHGIRHVWADHSYHGELITWANNTLNITIEVVARPRGKGFQLLARRWVVERTFAWISRRRRCARDYERLPEHHETIVYLAAALHMSRRAARLTTTEQPKKN
jgi:transposase